MPRSRIFTSSGLLALACATFGLIFGGLVGGPIAHFLVWKHKLTPAEEGDLTVGFRYKEHEIIDVDMLKVNEVVDRICQVLTDSDQSTN